MTKQDIQSRKDVELLVHHFYKKIRSNQQIGPFFNDFIEDWPLHKKRFTDFWFANLFSTPSYKGKTLHAHTNVDSHFNNGLKTCHFHLWVYIWQQSVDELYDGEKAGKAKKRAFCMAQCMCSKLMAQREQANQLAS